MSSPTSIERIGAPLRPDYSRVVYAHPPSHDFCVWIIAAELMRRHYGSPGPLRVWLRPAPSDQGPEYLQRMVNNVIRPAIQMIGAEEEYLPRDLPVTIHSEYDYHMSGLIDAGRQGCPVPRWTPHPSAVAEVDDFLKGERPVVITLRECAWQPERNSNINAWLQFAESIKGRHHPVVFVRDTDKAKEPLKGFRTWPRASLNTHTRAALYQRALVNMMVCNGPNTWCIFSEAPYLIFKELVPALPDWDHGHARGWRDQDHMEVGDQYAWASPQQRLTWTDDTLENIRAAFDAFIASL